MAHDHCNCRNYTRSQLLRQGAAQAAQAGKGLPAPEVLLLPTILIELGGGLMLLLGIKARWAALAILLWMIPVTLVVVLGLGGFGKLFERGNEVFLGTWMFALLGAVLVGGLVGAFPWWMAAFDEEKRALHDRVCATRVVRK